MNLQIAEDIRALCDGSYDRVMRAEAPKELYQHKNWRPPYLSMISRLTFRLAKLKHLLSHAPEIGESTSAQYPSNGGRLQIKLAQRFFVLGGMIWE